MRIYYSLYGRLLSLPVLIEAFKHVKRNRGAPGVDGQSLSEFEANLDVELSCLLNELKEKRYQAQPVRRVVLARPGGGERLLGIPTVRDRIVQQTLKQLLEPLFEPDFHPSSYGYRPGRSAHQAINKAQLFINTYHRYWVVDMDLSKCFDTLDHDLIIALFRERCTSKSAAENALTVATAYLETTLKLRVNRDKTHLAHSREGVAFLGVELFTGYTRIQPKKVVAFKATVKGITRRNQGRNLMAMIRELNPVLRGLCQLLPGSELQRCAE